MTEKIPSLSGDPRPAGFLPIGIFFVFGAGAAAFAAFTLLFPATPLDALWALNQRGHAGLARLGHWAAAPFVVLSPLLALAAVGWFQRRRWGWALGIAIVALNMAGDLGQIVFGERWKGAVGVIVAGILLVYMTRTGLAAYFRRT